MGDDEIVGLVGEDAGDRGDQFRRIEGFAVKAATQEPPVRQDAMLSEIAAA